QSQRQSECAKRRCSRALSFTRCWRRLRRELINLRATDNPEQIAEALQRLLLRLRQCKLPRLEPRAVRTRPRTYIHISSATATRREKNIAKELKA
ncbi:hypothetical protein DWB58_01945, partial [candidate division KSB1 bacterium]|nr:hypothetical protein [candidate division KSB1 bacterium]